MSAQKVNGVNSDLPATKPGQTKTLIGYGVIAESEVPIVY